MGEVYTDKKIKNVIFDVGRVLIDWTPNDTMRAVGCTEEEVKLLNRKLFVSGIWNEEDRSALSREELADLFVAQAPELEDKIRAFYARATESARLRPYVHEWIRGLKAAGYRVYILSNFGRQAWKVAVDMGAIDFLDMTDGYLVSYMIREIKPDPAIFEELIRRFGLKKEECIFVDDSPKNVEGAENVGIRGVLFNDYEDVCRQLESFGVVW